MSHGRVAAVATPRTAARLPNSCKSGYYNSNLFPGSRLGTHCSAGSCLPNDARREPRGSRLRGKAPEPVRFATWLKFSDLFPGSRLGTHCSAGSCLPTRRRSLAECSGAHDRVRHKFCGSLRSFSVCLRSTSKEPSTSTTPYSSRAALRETRSLLTSSATASGSRCAGNPKPPPPA